jgi:multicomponent Na+:H+ antiporter subunit D
LGAIEEGMWFYVAIIIISSLLNAIYFFRVLENVYMKKAEREVKDIYRGRKLELPLQMLIPVVVLGLSILILGIFNEPIVSQVIQFAIPGGGL